MGRGTSTHDGAAIASATVKHLVDSNRCLSLFATHYHSILEEHKDCPSVRLGHMQCIVDEQHESGDMGITFLYSLGDGVCPKSFGVNVARMAHLPREVLENAKKRSEEFEEEVNGRNEAEVEKQITKMVRCNDFDALRALQRQLMD